MYRLLLRSKTGQRDQGGDQRCPGERGEHGFDHPPAKYITPGCRLVFIGIVHVVARHYYPNRR